MSRLSTIDLDESHTLPLGLQAAITVVWAGILALTPALAILNVYYSKTSYIAVVSYTSNLSNSSIATKPPFAINKAPGTIYGLDYGYYNT